MKPDVHTHTQHGLRVSYSALHLQHKGPSTSPIKEAFSGVMSSKEVGNSTGLCPGRYKFRQFL